MIDQTKKLQQSGTYGKFLNVPRDLDSLSVHLSRGAHVLRSKQAEFQPKQMALHVARALGLPLLPALLVQFDKQGRKATAMVAPR